MAKREQVTLDTLLNDPRFTGIKNEAVRAEVLRKFSVKYPDAVRDVQAPTATAPPSFGGVQGGGSTTAGMLGAPLPEDDPSGAMRARLTQPDWAPMMGQAPEGSWWAEERKPGGMLSNEAIGTELAGAAVGVPPGARFATKLGMRGVAGLLGGSIGGMTEGTSPLESGPRGALSLGLGGMAGDAMTRVGSRALRPLGQLSPEQSLAASEMSDLGLLPKVSAIRGDKRIGMAEGLAGTSIAGSSYVQTRSAAEKIAEQASLIDMAERITPGAKADFEEVSKAMRAGFETQNEATKIAADTLFERSKDVMETAMPGGVYPITNLQRSAAKVIGTESPLQPFAKGTLPKAHGILNQFGEQAGVNLPPGRTHQPVSATAAEQLSMAGYDPEKAYTYPELLSLTQRLGRAVAGQQKDHVARAELTHMWRAANDDLVAAAETAGVPEAITMLDAAKDYYKANIIGIFRNSKVLKTMVKQDPSEAAKTLFSPSTTPEQLRRVRRAVGPDAYKTVQASWIKDLAERRSVNQQTGEFDAREFLGALGGKAGYTDAQLKELVGSQFGEFKKLQRVLQRAEGSGSRSEKLSLANVQIGAFLSGVASLAFGSTKGALIGAGAVAVPELLGLALSTDRGIRLLTVGLQAPPGSKQAIKAASELASLWATRPPKEGEGGGFSPARMFTGN